MSSFEISTGMVAGCTQTYRFLIQGLDNTSKKNSKHNSTKTNFDPALRGDRPAPCQLSHNLKLLQWDYIGDYIGDYIIM